MTAMDEIAIKTVAVSSVLTIVAPLVSRELFTFDAFSIYRPIPIPPWRRSEEQNERRDNHALFSALRTAPTRSSLMAINI